MLRAVHNEAGRDGAIDVKTARQGSMAASKDGLARDVAHELGLTGLADRAVYGIAIGDVDNDGEDEILGSN